MVWLGIQYSVAGLRVEYCMVWLEVEYCKVWLGVDDYMGMTGVEYCTV
jgi:hypothetical protein